MRIILYLAIVAVIYIAYQWLIKQPKSVRWRYAGIAAGIGLIVLVAMGRAPWIFAIIGALLPMARRIMGLANMLPMFQQLYSKLQSKNHSSSTSRNQGSTVQTEFIRMSLVHESGEMAGTVLKGRFAGKTLASMDQAQLTDLFEQCLAQDNESASLLNAYLDRAYGDEWRERQSSQDTSYSPSSSNQMSLQEAYDILGLAEDASREDIIASHRRLIQRLHPDRGGSVYLASKLNQAKKILLVA